MDFMIKLLVRAVIFGVIGFVISLVAITLFAEISLFFRLALSCIGAIVGVAIALFQFESLIEQHYHD